MRSSTKQRLLSDLISAGFDKKEFSLKKVGGFLTLIVNELNNNSIPMLLIAKKYYVDLQFNGYIYGIGAIEEHLSHASNN